MIIQPFTLIFSKLDCRLLCLLSCVPMIRVEHSFLFAAGTFPCLVFPMVKVALTCFDFRMYVELIIHDYILIRICCFFRSGYVQCYACVAMSDIFQQRVSCTINQLSYRVVVTYCLFTSCSSLDKPQHGTDFS